MTKPTYDWCWIRDGVIISCVVFDWRASGGDDILINVNLMPSSHQPSDLQGVRSQLLELLADMGAVSERSGKWDESTPIKYDITAGGTLFDITMKTDGDLIRFKLKWCFNPENEIRCRNGPPAGVGWLGGCPSE
jgi:hypothetical protein